MKVVSPLRYPGGKSILADLLSQIRRLNSLGNWPIAEPFAGGAGASLTLLYLEETRQIFINDADTAIHDFWWSLVNQHEKFIGLLIDTKISIAEWERQRKIYNQAGRVSRIRRGFATFYLNRCNRSGIIMNGGPIGGINQTGKWKIDARFNKPNLKRRCEKVAEYRDRIKVSSHDGAAFLDLLEKEKIMFFIDPPYFEKGPTLYLNSLHEDYHCALANRLRTMEDKTWVLTYDDCPNVRQLYHDWAQIRPYSLRYTANTRGRGNEILIAPKWMQLPDSQSSAALGW